MLDSAFWPSLAALAVTYVMHSSIALGAVWLVLKTRRRANHALIEWMWKAATLIGLVTAPLQCLGLGHPLFRLTLGERTAKIAEQDERYDSRAFLPAVPDPTPGAPQATLREPDESSSIDAWVFTAPAEVAATLEPPARNALQSPDIRWSARSDSRRLAIFGGMAGACWTVLAAARSAMQIVRLRRLLAECTPLCGCGVRQVLDRLRRRTGIRRKVQLCRSTRFTTPFACGLWNWTIVLPDGCIEDLKSDELEALLAHELAHFARRDPQWMMIGHVLRSWLAFQPLNRLAVRSWQAAAEYQCDEWAVARIRSPLSLARCLTRLAESHTSAFDPTLKIAALGAADVLVDRVERILAPASPPSSRAKSRCLVAVAATVTALLVMTWAPGAFCPAQASSPDNELAPAARISDTGSEGMTDAARTELRAEWSELRTDLQRVSQLLDQRDSNPAIAETVERLRQRSFTIDGRLSAILSEQD